MYFCICTISINKSLTILFVDADAHALLSSISGEIYTYSRNTIYIVSLPDSCTYRKGINKFECSKHGMKASSLCRLGYVSAIKRF